MLHTSKYYKLVKAISSSDQRTLSSGSMSDNETVVVHADEVVDDFNSGDELQDRSKAISICEAALQHRSEAALQQLGAQVALQCEHDMQATLQCDHVDDVLDHFKHADVTTMSLAAIRQESQELDNLGIDAMSDAQYQRFKRLMEEIHDWELKEKHNKQRHLELQLMQVAWSAESAHADMKVQQAEAGIEEMTHTKNKVASTACQVTAMKGQLFQAFGHDIDEELASTADDMHHQWHRVQVAKAELEQEAEAAQAGVRDAHDEHEERAQRLKAMVNDKQVVMDRKTGVLVAKDA